MIQLAPERAEFSVRMVDDSRAGTGGRDVGREDVNN